VTLPAFDTSGNSSFSKALPGLQLAWDSTSLRSAKTCLRLYYYSHVLGLEPRTRSPHLTFGLLIHRGCEVYDHLRADGFAHEQAVIAVVRDALEATWDRELGRGWASDHRVKNRQTLIQTLVWYLDALGENDPLETLRLANGKPAVELSFSFSLGANSHTTDEPLLYCGHMDRVARMGGHNYVVDHKSTERPLDPRYFGQFSPDIQFSGYTLAGRVAFGFETEGLIVNAMQVGVGFARFARHPVPRTEAQLDEFLDGALETIHRVERAAETGQWPMNETACSNFGGCVFREICSKPPGARDVWLKAGFKPRQWDPLTRRGDI
jgi:hypothetical protein